MKSIHLEEEVESDADSIASIEEPVEHEVDLQSQLHSHHFHIVGSNWVDRYQVGLNKCFQLRVEKETVVLRAMKEPDNIRDKNAIMFEVFQSGSWWILGYCGVKKIPKLARALHRNEVVSVELLYVKRQWFAEIMDFRFYGMVNIVKKGNPWGRDDVHNVYNSHIDLDL